MPPHCDTRDGPVVKAAKKSLETGIDRLDWILLDVYRRNFGNDETITDELIKRVRQFNYIPTKKMDEYRAALLREYKMLRPDDIRLMEERQENQEESHA